MNIWSQMKGKPRRSGALATGALAVAALLAAGCGGGGGSSGGGGGSSSGSTQTVSGKVVTVANSAILSGPEAAYSGISSGLKAYLGMVNNSGGVNGYTFKIQQRDNAYQPAQAVGVARQLVLNGNPFVFVSQGDAPTNAVLPLAPQIKATTFVISDASLTQKGGPNWYGVEADFTRQVLYSAKYAVKTLGLKKIAFATEENASSQRETQAMQKYVPSIGGQFVGSVSFQPTVTNFAPYASKLQSSGAQAVVLSGGGATQAGLQKAAAAIGYHPKWMGFFAAISPQFAQLADGQAPGTYFENFYLPTTDTSNPAVSTFLNMVRKVDPNATNLLGELGWEAGALIAAGVQKATAGGQKLSEASFRAALDSLQGKSVGVWPSVTYTTSYHAGPTSADILQFKNGSFQEVQGFSPLPQLP